MIYATQARAEEIAAMLNARLGHPPAYAVLTEHGWTVIASWLPINGRFGVLKEAR